ncbi:AtpZ/AtpI family protein [Agaricicola taiwanensis]|nr:AtpZ/AtpI family protein [Agaricicola taiwanensis]
MSNGDRDETQASSNSGSGDLSERLRSIDAALDRARSKQKVETSKNDRRATDNRGFAVALRLSSEFIAGVVAGGGLGWMIDYWFETSPWGLIVCVLLGFVAGVLNVMRAAGLAGQGLGGTASPDGGSKSSKDE